MRPVVRTVVAYVPRSRDVARSMPMRDTMSVRIESRSEARRVDFSDYILEGRVVHQDVLETIYAEINERYGTSVPVPPVR